MDDLTGGDGLHSSRMERSSFNQRQPSLPDRKPISPHLDVTGEQMDICAKQSYQIPLDASRQNKKAFWSSQTSLGRWLKAVNSKISNRKSIEILRVVHLCQRDKDNFIDGWIAEFKPGDQFLGSTVTIRGWIVGRHSQPSMIQATINSTVVAESLIDVPRPDVLRVVPFNTSFCQYGFRLIFNAEKLPSQIKLNLQAIFQDGNSVPAGLIDLCKYGF